MNQDFLDLLRAFIDHDVRFLIVGAYALAVHGRPRATGGLNVWVEATPENAAKVMSALEHFGAPTAQLRAQDFSRPGIVFQMGLPPACHWSRGLHQEQASHRSREGHRRYRSARRVTAEAKPLRTQRWCAPSPSPKCNTADLRFRLRRRYTL